MTTPTVTVARDKLALVLGYAETGSGNPTPTHNTVVAMEYLRVALSTPPASPDAGRVERVAILNHLREVKIAAGRHRLAVHALGRIKDGKTLFELSPSKDQECFDAWQELNDSGKALDLLITFPTAGIIEGALDAAHAEGREEMREEAAKTICHGCCNGWRLEGDEHVMLEYPLQTTRCEATAIRSLPRTQANE